MKITLLLSLIGLSSLSTLASAAELPACVDSRKMVVSQVTDPNLQVPVRATWAPDDEPMMAFNPDGWQRLSRPLQVFLYEHECAHHALGHLVDLKGADGRSMRIELEADCWAATRAREEKLLSKRDLKAVFKALQAMPYGEDRIVGLQACMEASRPPARRR